MKFLQSEGSFTVEMAVLFPLLFLLWLWVLRCLFGLYGQVVTETGVLNTIDKVMEEISSKNGEGPGTHNTEELWDAAAPAKIQKALEEAFRNGALKCQIERIEAGHETRFFYDVITVQATVQHILWGSHPIQVRVAFARAHNASLRNRIDFLFDVGEELPVTAPILSEIKEKVKQFSEG